jgi:hypothetical protein
MKYLDSLPPGAINCGPTLFSRAGRKTLGTPDTITKWPRKTTFSIRKKSIYRDFQVAKYVPLFAGNIHPNISHRDIL